MGLTAWYFLRHRVGELRLVPQTKMFAFLEGRHHLEPGEDGFVRYVEVVVRLEERKAVELISIVFRQARALEDGHIDRGHSEETTSAQMQIAFGPIKLSNGGPEVIRASHRFAERRLEHLQPTWEPEPADILALRLLVNGRAKASLM